MKNLLALFILSLNIHAGIYNTDDRHEIIDAPREIQDISKSIAAVIPKNRVKKLENGDFKLNGLSYVESLNFCEDERFVQTQSIIANCSASLVGSKKVATAAHCFDEYPGSTFNDYYIVFDYIYDHTNTEDLILNKDSVYEIKNTIQYTFNFPGDKDVALLELEREVVNRTPLKVSKRRVQESEEIYMLGFPLGLPMKYHDNGFVTSLSSGLAGNNSFSHNLDTFSVNSGSSIFSSKTNEIVGILVRGIGENFTYNNEKSCNVWGNGNDHSGQANFIDLLKI
ncbi:serine protease [Halobacteriovorax sp.]|uniref:trypsin-like serine peptidase n=1 Tax=Halobacteriovorax sp. TaxID=2020862 RepID=UPI0035668DB2